MPRIIEIVCAVSVGAAGWFYFESKKEREAKEKEREAKEAVQNKHHKLQSTYRKVCEENTKLKERNAALETKDTNSQHVINKLANQVRRDRHGNSGSGYSPDFFPPGLGPPPEVPLLQQGNSQNMRANM